MKELIAKNKEVEKELAALQPSKPSGHKHDSGARRGSATNKTAAALLSQTEKVFTLEEPVVKTVDPLDSESDSDEERVNRHKNGGEVVGGFKPKSVTASRYLFLPLLFTFIIDCSTHTLTNTLIFWYCFSVA